MAKVYISDVSSLDVENRRSLALLDEDRLARFNRYQRRDDRQRCLGAGLMLHRVLGDCSSLAKSIYGKPYLAHKKRLNASPESDLAFSISHSGTYVVLALATRGLIGCDVQQQEEQNYHRLAQKAFHAEELRQLEASLDKKLTFYRLWTLRESFLKACGCGLALDKDCFYFDLRDPSTVHLVHEQQILETLAAEPFFMQLSENDQFNLIRGLCFEELTTLPGYSLTLCSGEEIEAVEWIELQNVLWQLGD